MISKTIQNKIREKQVVFYRRVSTGCQEVNGLKHQLEAVKASYPGFTANHSTTRKIEETRSGRSVGEVRMATGLGKCCRHLKRNSDDIVIVSNFDRISRRVDVFELIRKQDLAGRIYDVSTGMNLAEFMDANLHFKIEKHTIEKREAQLKGMEKYREYGGKLGNSQISKHASKAVETKTEKANNLHEEILFVVKRMAQIWGEKRPTFGEIADVLNHMGVCTGQGRIFTPERLSQLKKQSPEKWDYALDSYHRPRRLIQKAFDEAFTEIRVKRKFKRRKIWLFNINIRWVLRSRFCDAYRDVRYSYLTKQRCIEKSHQPINRYDLDGNFRDRKPLIEFRQKRNLEQSNLTVCLRMMACLFPRAPDQIARIAAIGAPYGFLLAGLMDQFLQLQA